MFQATRTRFQERLLPASKLVSQTISAAWTSETDRSRQDLLNCTRQLKSTTLFALATSSLIGAAVATAVTSLAVWQFGGLEVRSSFPLTLGEGLALGTAFLALLAATLGYQVYRAAANLELIATNAIGRWKFWIQTTGEILKDVESTIRAEHTNGATHHEAEVEGRTKTFTH